MDYAFYLARLLLCMLLVSVRVGGGGDVSIDPVTQQNQADPSINNAGISGLPSRIAQAIKAAAARTGVDFSYLLSKAAQESSFDPNAKAANSSATGLFQFTNQTWLRMVKQHGAAYGLDNYASHISVDHNGVAHVKDPAWRQAILSLRQDPQISAEMAGELDKANLDTLKGNVGGKIGRTELYLAHFLGASGASGFLKSMRAHPNANAARVLPGAAAANPTVFYNAAGQPRSLAQVYRHFAEKFDGPATASSAIVVASAHSPSSSPSATSSYSYALASTTYTGATASASHYTPPVISGIRPNPSSLFATMVLAQTDIGQDTAMRAFGAFNAEARHKKDVLAVLSAVG